MATHISSISFRFLLSSSFLLLSLFCSLNKCYAHEGRKIAESEHLHHSHTVQVRSLLPSSYCSPSTKAIDKKSSLKVVHKHGPCSQLNQDKANAPSHTEILLQDQSRVNSIHSRLSKQLNRGDLKVTDSTTIPAKSGRTVGSGNYIVTVGIGTPKKDLSLIFDTGSDLTWTQCEPCVGNCYQQKEPKFDPSVSESYDNISCTSPVCNSLISATGNSFNCSSSTCVYGIQYGDSSFSVGFFGQETLTLTSKDVFKKFFFGCGQNNQGLFGGSAGLLGLGRDKLSFVSQTATKYKKIFSYCLPPSSSSTGHLTFGISNVSKSVRYTPLSTISQGTSFYGLDVTGLSVRSRRLNISRSVFKTAGMIIDSGTVITRLPPDAYTALSTAFKAGMTQYPTAPPLSILDTCYDFSNYSTVTIPKISFSFSGGVLVPIAPSGTFFVNRLSQVCLAFAGNSDASDVAIFGNTQQLTLEVVYDGAKGRVGFASKGCS